MGLCLGSCTCWLLVVGWFWVLGVGSLRFWVFGYSFVCFFVGLIASLFVCLPTCTELGKVFVIRLGLIQNLTFIISEQSALNTTFDTSEVPVC